MALKCFKEEGIFGFYKGMFTPLITSCVINALSLSSNEFSKKILGNEDESKLTIKESFIAGYLSGISCTVICTPTELIKCKLQIQNSANNTKYNGIFHLMKTMYMSEGFKSFYKGNVSTFHRETIGYSVQFGLYHTFKLSLCKLRNKDYFSLNYIDYILSGAFAGMLAWLFTYPIDFIKTLIQTGKVLDLDKKNNHFNIYYEIDTNHSSHDHILYKYKEIFKDGGTFNCFRHVYLTSGIFGLFKGLSPILIGSFIGNGLMFIVYEKVKRKLDSI